MSQTTQDCTSFRPFRQSGVVSSSAGQRPRAPPLPAADPSDRTLALAQLAQDLLSRIRERDRTACVLRFIEGTQADEIADVVGASVPTVRRRFTRECARVTFLAGRDPFLSRYVHHPAAKVHADEIQRMRGAAGALSSVRQCRS